jgi:hypothetical protein
MSSGHGSRMKSDLSYGLYQKVTSTFNELIIFSPQI